ncbi:MAG: alpha/beta hydrolase, partial [Sphingobacterium sp.]
INPQQLQGCGQGFHLGNFFIGKASTFSEDFRPEAKEIKVPVLVIVGKKDYAIGVNHYRKFQFPHQRNVLIEGGHVLYYEQK